MGGLLLEVLVLVFVFSYWSEDLHTEGLSTATGEQKPNSEIVLSTFSISTELNDHISKTNVKLVSIKNTFSSVLALALVNTSKKDITLPFATGYVYYSNPMINAP